jgi:hypothetical protein
VIAIACFQAIKAKDIQAEFSEATYIGLCMFTLCQAYLSGIPIVVVVRDIPKAFYLVLAFLILLLCMTILLLLFLPKILLQRKYTGMTRKDQKALMAVKLRKSMVGSTLGILADSSLQNIVGSTVGSPADSSAQKNVHYCWTHGLSQQGNHTSATCNQKHDGHVDDATAYDRKGGSQQFNFGQLSHTCSKLKMRESSSEKYLSKDLNPSEMPPLEDPSSMLEPSSEDHSNQTQTISA